MANLGNILFGAYRRRILALLLLHPDQSYYVREIARLTGKSAGTVHRELRLLAEVELLQRERVGNQVRYAANRSCPIFGELAAILRKTVGLADVLRDALEPLGARVSVAVVFGSVARGEERAGSDVDVLVVGRVSFTAIVKALSSAEKTIQREVNPVVLKPSEFGERLASGDAFLERILQDPKKST